MEAYYTITALSLPILLLLISFLFSQSKLKKRTNFLPPSPPSLPILGHLHLFMKKNSSLPRTLAAISADHGPVILLRLGSRTVLLVSSSSASVECFTTNDLAFASRPFLPSIRPISFNYSGLATAPYGHHWRTFRRLTINELVSSSRLRSFADTRGAELRALLTKLLDDSKGDNWCPIELKSRVFGMALNVIVRMLTGEKYYGEGELGMKKMEEFKEMEEELMARGGGFFVTDFFPFLKLIGLQWLESRSMSKLLSRRNTILQRLIDGHRQKKNSSSTDHSKCFMDLLLSMQEESPDHITDDVIKATVQSLGIAGSIPVTETLIWVMSLLLNHPTAMNKVKDEIDTFIGSQRLVEEEDLPNLPYLHAVITETLRLYPAVPLLHPHEAREDCTVAGYHVRRGTMLLVNVWAIHRDPVEWAAAEEFRPERFVGSESRGDGMMKTMIPFGMGRRGCPGEAMASLQIPLMLAAMIQCFEWKEMEDKEVDMMDNGNTLTLPKAVPLKVLCRPRREMMSLLLQLHD
ncbi:isoflavone 2'-hydroxylase [Dendrobium catenatum]|uniref:isoflavone 2'-hydroxylase n=1 Tax=Dendrobium catenatum TaxID=906689 RepID=UPI0009F6267C|nr:isoflavone 2'-hydroxylase [Dendrobium catenatum]